MSKDADREKRLAEALRANLRRRKDQQRAAAPPSGTDAKLTESGPAEGSEP